MHSPFDTVMSTAVLDAQELVRLMRRESSRAHRGADPACRDEEEDAVLLGKLLLLDELAWRTECEEMSATERAGLRAATHELGRAVEVLTARIAAAAAKEGDDGLTDPEEGGAR